MKSQITLKIILNIQFGRTILTHWSKYSPDAIELSDFVVDQQRIGLRGKVRRLDTIYVENGVIDRLTRLNFLSNIQIPSYQKIDDVYEFQIQWEVSSAKK